MNRSQHHHRDFMEIPRVQCFLVNTLHQYLQCRRVNIDLQHIPVYSLKGSWPLKYHSTLAFKLTKIEDQLSPDQIVSILEGLSSFRQWNDITLNILPSRIIEFELTDNGVVTWLQQMIQKPLPTSEVSSTSMSRLTAFSEQNLFAIQYSHARCCSLLRLADRDQIIILANPHPQITPPLWLWVKPNPIPWLDLNHKFQLDHPCEQQLIGSLMTALDPLNSSSEQRSWRNKADLISEAFQAFYGQCRIWGEVKLYTPERSQVRLGLIAVTQAILRYILQEKLKKIAPLEL